MTFEQWDVVVVPFPFADRAAARRRPALVISPADPLGNVVGHHVLAMITSAEHRRWPLDVPLDDLDAAGLPAPSVVRMKLFTLDGRLIERRAGALGHGDTSRVGNALARLFGGNLPGQPTARADTPITRRLSGTLPPPASACDYRDFLARKHG